MDKNGKILVVGDRNIIAAWSFEISEMAVALCAVEFAVRLGYCLAHIEGDALSVIMAIDKRSEGCSPIHLLLEKLLSSAYVLDGFVCSMFLVVVIQLVTPLPVGIRVLQTKKFVWNLYPKSF